MPSGYYARLWSPACNPAADEVITGQWRFGTATDYFEPYQATGDVLGTQSHEFYRNLDLSAYANPHPVVVIQQDHASAGAHPALSIVQDGTATTAYALESITTATGASNAIFYSGANDYVILGADQALATGTNYFYRNLGGGAATSGPVVGIFNDHASDDQYALFVQSDAANTGAAFYHTATNRPVIYAYHSANDAVHLIDSDASANGSSYFYRNLGAANTAGPIVRVVNAAVTDDQYCVSVENNCSASGGGITVDQNGRQYGIFIDWDYTHTNDYSAMGIDAVNAGAGNATALALTAYDYAFQFLPDTTAVGASDYVVPVYVAGIGVRYLELYPAS